VDRAGRELVEAIRGQHEQRPAARGPGQVADDLERQLVGPLQVLERQHRRTVDVVDDLLRDLANEDPPRSERIATLAALDLEQSLPERAEERGVHRSGQIAH